MPTSCHRWPPILCAVSLILATALAIWLRVPDLERRPMHSDEAVQAAKTGVLFDAGHYAYDPREFHGPTLYYFTLPLLWMSSARSYADSTEFNYRIVPVVFGVALVLLMWLFADGMGFLAVGCSGVLTAISPAMVFYSRYYIQEMLLVFFSCALIGCGWRYLKTRVWIWAVLTGVCAGLMHATKETCAIAFFSMGVALAVEWMRTKREAHPHIDSAQRRKLIAHAAAALGAAAFVSILFYSSFFTHARGPLDSILTYGNYLTRSAGANSHDKPWDYYFKLLLWNSTPGAPVWTESLIVGLALIGGATTFFPMTKIVDETRARFARFLTIYTLTMAAIYSLISYKTPWCVLSVLHGLILLAGIGAAAILKALPHWSLKTLAAILLSAGAAHLGWQAYLANGKYAFDTRNPYVYVHSTMDPVRLGKRIEELAALHPDGRKMLVKVMAPNGDYWPLPWYLRKMENVGYWSTPPAQIDAPVLIASDEFAPELRLELKGKYQRNTIGLRPLPTVPLTVYIDEELWKRFVATRQNGNRK